MCKIALLQTAFNSDSFPNTKDLGKVKNAFLNWCTYLEVVLNKKSNI
jgi:hypothetical protein